jgi:eukaryotic-like serine/threonine-protein kinase
MPSMEESPSPTPSTYVHPALGWYAAFENRLQAPATTPQGKEWVKYGFRILLIVLFIITLVVSFDVVIMPAYVGRNQVARVPNVTNMSYMQAVRILEDNGFTVKVGAEYYNNSISRGHVVSQMPFAASTVKPSRKVYLTLSLGRQMLEVPNLVGLSVRDARIALIRLGLMLDNAQYQFNDHVAANIIFTQSTAPKSKVGFGATVGVTVSLGPEAIYVLVPDLVGRASDEAERILIGAGFVLGTKTLGEKDETFVSGTILKQVPAAGDSVKAGTPVSITIAR